MGAHSQKRFPFSLLTPNKHAQKDTVDGRDGAGLNEPSSRNECTNRQVHGRVSSRLNCAIMQACLLCSSRPQLNSEDTPLVTSLLGGRSEVSWPTRLVSFPRPSTRSRFRTVLPNLFCLFESSFSSGNEETWVMKID